MLLKLSSEFGFRSGKCIPVHWISFDIVTFRYHLVTWCKLQIYAVGASSGFMWVYQLQAFKQENTFTKGQLKLTHMNFVILNSYVTVIYLRFIKKHFLGLQGKPPVPTLRGTSWSPIRKTLMMVVGLLTVIILKRVSESTFFKSKRFIACKDKDD